MSAEFTDDDTQDDTQSAEPDFYARTLKHYKLLQPIGRGGMGEVFLAQDTRLERLVALKILSSRLDDSKNRNHKLLSEARAAAKLQHPNICSVYSIEQSDGLMFIVMEYVQGETLQQIAKGHVPVNIIRSIGLQCCQALQAAATEGIVHGDIKSANIMIDRYNNVKIMDFGLARDTFENVTTNKHGIAGTLAYMSPEQITGKPIDWRSDMYSLGVVLFELLTGRLPFVESNRSALTHAIVYNSAPDLHTLRSDLPVDLVAITNRAMTKPIESRFETFRAMAQAFGTSSASEVGGFEHLATDPQMLAVLPVHREEEDDSLDHVLDALRDQLVSALSQISQLRVVSPKVGLHFDNTGTNLSTIGKDLGISMVLRTSTSHHENDLEIRMELVRCNDSLVLWSSRYLRSPESVLTLPNEICRQIVKALGLNFDEEPTPKSAIGEDNHGETYDLYLRGKFIFKRRDQASVERAIELFSRALEIDKLFAPAYSCLAIALSIKRTYGLDESGDLGHQAEALASRAVELDPGSSDAHVSLATVQRNSSLRQSITSLRTAIALDFNNYEAHHLLAHTYVLQGKYDDAAIEERAALQVDPFQEISRAHLCRIYFFLGQMEKAERQLDILTENDLATHLAHATRGWIHWCTGRWEQAIDSFEKVLSIGQTGLYTLDYLADCYRRVDRLPQAVACMDRASKINPHQYSVLARTGQLYEVLGQTDKARELFSKARTSLDLEFHSTAERISPVYHYNVALLYSLAGQFHQTVDQLHRAIEAGFGHYGDLRHRPDFALLRNNAEFVQLTNQLEERISRDKLV